MTGFYIAITKQAVKDGLEDRQEDDNWKCGICYVNVDVPFFISF